MKVTQTITIEIKGEKHELSPDDARALRDALIAAIGPQAAPLAPVPLPIIWPNYPPTQPYWVGPPRTTDPAPWQPPYIITCGAVQ